MKPRNYGVLALLVALILPAFWSIASADIRFSLPFEISIEPLGAMQKGSPITLQLKYEVNSNFRHLAGDSGFYRIIFIDPRDHTDTLSDITYPVEYDDTYSHSTTVQVMLPNADTNLCFIQMTCGRVSYADPNYFITNGNSVQFLDHFRMPPPLKYQSALPPEAYVSKEPMRDTLTQEQLQIAYEVYLDLRDSSHMAIARDILGIIPDSAIYNPGRKIYRLETTLENLIKLGDQNLEFHFTTPPPWDPQYNSPGDSSLDHQPADDAEDTLGFLPPPPRNSIKPRLTACRLNPSAG